jgi:hypothetical protein
MQTIRTLLAAVFFVVGALPAAGQTIKTLGYNSTNGHVVYSGTNTLTFTNAFKFGDDLLLSNNIFKWGTGDRWAPEDNIFFAALQFDTTNVAAGTRTNLSLGATWLTNTNVTNFRSAIGLGQADNVQIGWDGGSLTTDDFNAGNINVSTAVTFATNAAAAATRTNLSLGASNIVTFAGLTNNGDIRINQTATNNGLLYIYRTNSEAFLGMANLIASNNVTVSNETLFRVGVAEATNKAAQFGFRATNTNGTGVAVFSTFGNNALMMIGASDRSQTNAAIEADIWTISPTNRVMTLRDTNTGAMTMHRDIGFAATLTNAAPTNTTNVAVWLRVWVGSNSYRLPLYQ